MTRIFFPCSSKGKQQGGRWREEKDCSLQGEAEESVFLGFKCLTTNGFHPMARPGVLVGVWGSKVLERFVVAVAEGRMNLGKLIRTLRIVA